MARPTLKLVSNQSASAVKLRKELRGWIDKMEPNVRKGFQESIDNLKSELILSEVTKALRGEDVEKALKALHIDSAAFTPYKSAITTAYNGGGDIAAKKIPKLSDNSGNLIVVRFDAANRNAEREIANIAGDRITFVTTDTIQAARAIVLDGYAKGYGPAAIALDLAGRLDRRTGRRVGGVLGMSEPQAKAALNLRNRLLSGDPSEMRKVFSMELRDKRFDGMIKKAIESGSKLSVADVNRMYGRYVDASILLRSNNVARTETGRAVHAAAHTAFRQGLNKTNYIDSDISRTWRATADKRTRHSHEEMDGQTVYGLNTPFLTPSGQRLLHPLDPSLGAGPEEIINCRCDEEIDIDFSAGVV